jgi:hypothetical protein
MGAGAWASGYGECDIVAVLRRDLNVSGSHGDRLWLVSLLSRIGNMLRADPGVADFVVQGCKSQRRAGDTALGSCLGRTLAARLVWWQGWLLITE